jgi:3-phosphoshikimate 1-carboxyvinyltransferase
VIATDAWAAPNALGAVRGSVLLPGSKSLTNRALVLAALADGPSTVSRPLRARDTLLMAAGLRAMGADITDVTDVTGAAGSDGVEGADGRAVPGWRLVPGPARPATVDCGLAGTVARFLPPVAALGDAAVTFDGDERMRDRPMGPLLQALRSLGARVDADALPVTVRGPARGGPVSVDASTSSQLLSGLLLVGASLPGGLDVRHVGPPLVSAHHIAMTVALLRDSGVTVATETDRWTVTPGSVRAVDRVVEPDMSSASAFLAAAVATGGEVHIPGWPRVTRQPGAELPDLLTGMGATYAINDSGLTLRGGGAVHGVDVDLRDVSELALTIAALAVLADGPSRLRGIAHMRLQETDRLAAFAEQLGRLGAHVEVTDDGLAITPTLLTGGVALDPYADHRLAMAYAVVGLMVPGVSVLDIATTGKTVPDFPALWAGLLA